MAVLSACAVWPMAGAAQTSATAPVTTLEEVRVLGTAEEELKQAPGVSVITEDDLQKRPPANDLAELIRTMPGVNLTGNSASGAYGNNRQIDLRGMGPENTLILIDGKPVASRDSVRMGRNGERNTRGDSNWVPVEAIERIEVVRGPAAARYGSGAAGGVVNIITKRPSDKLSGSVTLYGLEPEHSEEGGTRRASFNLAGPISEQLSFRLYGNVAKTEADSPELNALASGIPATDEAIPPAGREGVKNRDINGLLRWDLAPGHVVEFEGGYSRQGNIYAGDRLFTSSSDVLSELANEGAETNTMYRRTGSITHRGDYGDGRTSRVTAYYEGTTNSRMNEGLAGGGEGTISNPDNRSTSKLDNYLINGEYNTPWRIGSLSQIVTVGGEFRRQRLDDEYSTRGGAGISGDPSAISAVNSSALFIEDNIEATQDLIITPGLRMDHHQKFGVNWSPSLNASYYVTPTITLKGGIARAFKAPNLYQINPNYMYTTRGNGCPFGPDGNRVEGPCNIFGNADLDPEISVNKEIGIAYDEAGWGAGVTYFRNDYKNKIVADMGDQAIPDYVDGRRSFQWVNSGAAVIQGFEGNLNVPLLGESGRTLMLTNNFTYMVENKSKSTGQPLSVIPRYTINSALAWQVNERFDVLATATFYGKQRPRTYNLANNAEITGDGLNVRGSYAVFGLSAGYRINERLHLRAGVNNIGDKRLFREDSGSAQGAATYNEPGRAYYATLTASF
ncbi:TonB-dependent siderophore receptor [Verticiella sediminum]|uniref:TonB-dependent siderophore receptor n=1 Tax=Verticiella sediminum TaxID=1247510 RepID=A0A556AVY6_9BURK|nr:FepA family TonB-dependent siderophore receptor [Verticiella sediminum]TSH97087.1 TonB-dependent siderophore receptor [Verticiella sediminum]